MVKNKELSHVVVFNGLGTVNISEIIYSCKKEDDNIELHMKGGSLLVLTSPQFEFISDVILKLGGSLCNA